MKNMNDEIKHQLDKQADSLSQPIQDKLAAARKQALLQAKISADVGLQGQSGSAKPAANDTQWLKPLLALAACVCLVVPLWLSGVVNVDPVDVKHEIALANPTQPSNLSLEKEMEQQSVLLELASLNDDELELVENLDFALWLLRQEQSPS